MCLLTYYPPFAEVNTDRLECGAECNPHGHGFAIVTNDGKIIVDHAMTPARLIARFAKLRAQYPNSHALFHSRITTHGSTTLANCHPFRVVGPRGGQTVLAHNGVLPTDCQPRKGDARSDTRILAEEMLWNRWSKFRLPSLGSVRPRSTKRWLDSPEVRADIESWLGTGSKVLVLTTNPRLAQTAYLFNERLGEWVDGVWYSNSSYERWYSRGRSSYGSAAYVYQNGKFVRTTGGSSLWDDDDYPTTIGKSSTKAAWWEEEWNDVSVSGATSEGALWLGRTWYPTQSYKHHFARRTCDVCESVRVSKHDYVCDICGVCWICNEYFTDCHSEASLRCGMTKSRRGGFDQAAGHVWTPGEPITEPIALPSAPVKSAEESAQVFVNILKGGSDNG